MKSISVLVLGLVFVPLWSPSASCAEKDPFPVGTTVILSKGLSNDGCPKKTSREIVNGRDVTPKEYLPEVTLNNGKLKCGALDSDIGGVSSPFHIEKWKAKFCIASFNSFDPVRLDSDVACSVVETSIPYEDSDHITTAYEMSMNYNCPVKSIRCVKTTFIVSRALTDEKSIVSNLGDWIRLERR